jgi:hypothetical protein
MLLAGGAVGQSLPKTDIEWTAEHLAESVQDSRLLALPWPDHALVAGAWQGSVDAGWQSATADVAEASGFLLAGGATYAVSERRAYGGFAFYDRLSIGGNGGQDVLRVGFSREVPLALPAWADFSDPRGEVRHFGLGGDVVWQRQRVGSAWRRTILAGGYAERLELVGYQLDYRLTSGPDAGSRGVVDYSASYSFLVPFVAIAWTRPLGSHWTLSPRLIAAQPLPRAGLAGTIRGDTVAASGSGDTPAMGDGYLGAGVAFEHLPSGLAFDLGSSVFYAGTEGLTHEGLTQALLLHVTWHVPSRRAR